MGVLGLDLVKIVQLVQPQHAEFPVAVIEELPLVEQDFAADLAHSKAVNYWEWSRRSLLERGHEWLGWLLERQQ